MLVVALISAFLCLSIIPLLYLYCKCKRRVDELYPKASPGLSRVNVKSTTELLNDPSRLLLTS